VTDVEFLGSFSRCHLKSAAEAGTEFRADLSANRARNLQVGEGRILYATFPDAFIRVYDEINR
jgi:hypothetical protein